VTDRYARAIEQLGSDKLDVRIGGIHALERIARDSPRDHPTIMAVLAAFILEHSREQWPPAEPGAEPPERTTRPDVQAAATVIGRRNSGHNSEQINLNAAVLTRADLTGADLSSSLWPSDAAVPAGWQRGPGSDRLERASTWPGDAPTDPAPTA
jgi:hypothetical protein